MQEQGIEPDILVPQLSDANRNERPRLREADLRNHLVAEKSADEKLIEDDGKVDPRFAMTADELKKQGVTDYQLDYAVKMIGRLGPAPVKTAAR